MTKRILACAACLMLLTVSAFADGERVFVAGTDDGSMLITESGAKITEAGEYDVIVPVTYDDCPAERMLFAVSHLDLGDGFFADEGGEADWKDMEEAETGWEDMEEAGTDWDDAWEDELDDVEAWPDEDGGLEEGYDMDVVDDQEWSDFGEDGFYEDDFSGEEEFDYGLLDDEYIDYGMEYGVALMNAAGELLTGFDYVSFDHDVENATVFACDFDGWVTALDERGNILAAGPYTSMVSDGNGGFFAVAPEMDEETGELSELAALVHVTAAGDINNTGLITNAYEPLSGFSDGLMCVMVCDGYDGESPAYSCVYVDQNGADAFGCSFDFAASFMGGCAEVIDDNNIARLIDRNGNYVTDAEYSYFDCGEQDDGMSIVANLIDGGFDIISGDGFEIIASFRPENGATMLYAYHSGDGLIMAYSENEMMILDASGSVLYRGADDMYAYTWYEFCDSQPQRLLVTRGEGTNAANCVADLSGVQQSDWYREISALSWMGGEGRYLVCDYDLIEVTYDGVTVLEPDVDTCRYGVIDQDGNVVVEMKYDYFDCLAADRYWVSDGAGYQLLDDAGNVIAEMSAQ